MPHFFSPSWYLVRNDGSTDNMPQNVGIFQCLVTSENTYGFIYVQTTP